MSAHALLEEHPHPTRAEIEEGMAGNLCRCACYEQIFDAIEAVADGAASPEVAS
jgi:aerobic-type carbon monoxide dehydrogenase small subunit (CoxS/CutS family)